MKELLAAADRRGVDVRGLIWRSHLDALSFSAEENRQTGEQLQRNGAEALLDMRVRTGGSHHQKLVVIRHRDHPERDVAYVGGIDLCHSRRDDARHLGDPQPQRMAAAYGDRPPWHDVQVAISGPAVHDVETVFRERWQDPTPLSRHPVAPDPRPAEPDRHPTRTRCPSRRHRRRRFPAATHLVQLLRTYPNLRHGRDYPFAVGGERSMARGYSKALARAQQLVYIEDQYLWSRDVAAAIVASLRESPELRVIAVLPHLPDQSKALSRIPQEFGRAEAIGMLRAAAPDRFACYGLENHDGVPVYVHAKVCVMDDWWATIGSDNFNRRSWTPRLGAVGGRGGSGRWRPQRVRPPAAVDAGRRAPRSRRSGRRGVPRRHLPDRAGSRRPDDLDDADLLREMADCVDGPAMFDVFAASAAALQAWHDGGRSGPRPPGRLRPLRVPRLSPVDARLGRAVLSDRARSRRPAAEPPAPRRVLTADCHAAGRTHREVASAAPVRPIRRGTYCSACRER